MFYGIFNYLSSMVNSKYEMLNPLGAHPLVKLKNTELYERVREKKQHFPFVWLTFSS
jgi:hypothetical protein